ncbi:MAG: TIGR00159 family protein [Candidatus Omnitrophica bacterium]|nr:TIGR00159 family protein [Candidatus Omnitrophota bacterium]
MTLAMWGHIKPFLEIAILWFAYYRVLVFFEGTRAFQVFRGIAYLLLAFIIFQLLGFNTLNWLLTKFFALSIVVFMIVFQQEIRQGLAHLGRHHIFSFGLEESTMLEVIEELTSAAFKLSRKKVGCLMALERETKLKTYIESGVAIRAKVSSELIQSIFTPQSPLHDGGIILREDQIVAASCLFPLSDNPNFSKIIGTRHRAALGITEQTDTVVIIVSEETGEISVACDGRFIPIVNRERLVRILKDILMVESKEKKTL